MFVRRISKGHVVATQKRPLTSLLIKPIHLEDAKPRGLRASFAQAPDESDIKAYLVSEIKARFAALDTFFRLKSDSPDIWERRAKALVAYQFDLQPDCPDQEWWVAFTWYLVSRHLPGFALKSPGEKKRGAPLEWTFKRFAELFADVEFLRRKTRLSVTSICRVLSKQKGYERRWGNFGAQALRKAYVEAKKLRRQNFLFELELCGPSIAANGIDPIQAAIDAHSLKI
jgi:hypothetical protein